jgi:outer membrane receptor protein involved in Fe transport
MIFHSGLLLPNSSEIRGVVKDIYNQPVTTASIQILPDGGVTLSDHEGKFQINVPEELKDRPLSLIASHRRYHSQVVKLGADRGNGPLKILMIPKEHIKEEISVTALNRHEQIVEVPMAESSLSELDIKEQMPENVAGTLTTIPGIHFIGKGGFSVTPSIRGLARRRVLIIVDGARLTSDRRVGVSASFIPPSLIRRIEVVRSSSSVLYGSDAIGGVVQIFTSPKELSKHPKNSFHLNMNSGNQRLATGVSLEKKRGNHLMSAGFNFLQAENYSSPDQEVLHSGYTYYSGTFNIGYYNEERNVSIGYIGGFGKDIGKPERQNSPSDYSLVPEESEQILRLSWIEKQFLNSGTLAFSAFVNPSHYNLEKISDTRQSYQQAITDVTNLGVKMSFQKSLAPHLAYRLGLEWFSRQNLEIENRDTQQGILETTLPLAGGLRSDLGVFATIDYSGLKNFDIIGGVRYSLFSLEANVAGKNRSKSSSAPSAFLGVTRKLGSSASLFLDIGKAFRLPSLSESFYTGISGRRYVMGNPNLHPESSLNVDAGIKFFSEAMFLGLYGFSYTIEDMIERFRDETGVTTYDNITKGRIRGIEAELQYFPLKGLELFGHLSLYKGRVAGTATPLNDVPAARLFLGGKIFVGKFWGEINYLRAFAKKDPGPAEVYNRDYNLLNIKGGYYFSSNLFLFCRVSNVLDTLYFANPDPDIPEAPGIQASAGLQLYF